ncbi:MAG: hypothetical protein EAZ70_13445 [Runella slithyformis]|nr:MAG: hypothetical protein EAY79_08310 [Runella slithyformis]TAF23033.1 MAG: hypothetical protein EAZ70_13445 [Runella slithyformis]TAF49206.1 MAG: hypothetical protein EAZ63_01935 [Runella slithyformis]TAF80789.1 MAG: hypothetical protein EAZ50_08030 [Runella slithyformis]
MKSMSRLIFCLVFFAGTAFAQDRFSVNIAAGKSISLRELAVRVTGRNSLTAQMAGDGLAFQVGTDFQFSRHLGFTARLNYNQNETREEGVKNYAAVIYSINDLTASNIQDWRALSLMVGPTLKVFVGKLSLQGRLLGGYTTITGPAFSAKGSFSNRDISVETKTGTAQNWAFGLGSTVAFALTSHLSLAINADYAQTKAEFGNIENVVTAAGTTLTPTTTIVQDLGVLNVTGGLVFSF